MIKVRRRKEISTSYNEQNHIENILIKKLDKLNINTHNNNINTDVINTNNINNYKCTESNNHNNKICENISNIYDKLNIKSLEIEDNEYKYVSDKFDSINYMIFKEINSKTINNSDLKLDALKTNLGIKNIIDNSKKDQEKIKQKCKDNKSEYIHQEANNDNVDADKNINNLNTIKSLKKKFDINEFINGLDTLD